MKKLQFSIEINAPKEKVWDTLWQDENYRKWTSVFMEGSFAESDWKEGGKIHFLTSDRNGMFGIIEKLVPFEKMYFLHKGEVLNGIEQEETYGTEAIERYHLIENEEKTTLEVTLNTMEEYLGYFANTFPKALKKIKQLSEN